MRARKAQKQLQKLVPAVSAVTLAWLGAEASGQMIYEPFDYGATSVGTTLEGTTGPGFGGYVNIMNGRPWAEAFSGLIAATSTGAKILAGNLILAGRPASTGNSGGKNQPEPMLTPRIALGTTAGFTAAGTTLYYSFLFNLTDATNIRPNTDAQGVILAGFNNTIGTQAGQPGVIGARLQIRAGTAADTFQLGIRSNSTQPVQFSGDLAMNTPHFVVGGYQIVSGLGGADDISALWVNPSSSDYGAANAPAPPLSIAGGDITTQVGSFLIRDFNQSTGVGAPQGFVMDDIRIDQSWGQVTMPVGTAWAGGNGTWSSSLPDGVNNFVNFNPGGGNVTVDVGGKTVGTVTIQSVTPYAISGAPLTMSVGGTGNTFTAFNVVPQMDGTSATPPAATHSISSDIVLNNNLEANIGLNQTLSLAGNISGTGIINKNGGGVLALSGVNTFDAATSNIIINDGTVSATSDAALGPAPGSPTTKINNNRGTLRLDGTFSTDVNRNMVNAGGSAAGLPEPLLCQTEVTAGNTATFAGVISNGAMVKGGAGTLVLGNASNTYAANIIAAGTLVAPGNSNMGTAAGAVTFAGGILRTTGAFVSTRNLFVTAAGNGTVDTAGNDVTFGNISGSGSFTKTGAGILTTGASGGTAPRLNTSAGNLTVGGGTLLIAAGGQANGVAIVNTTAVSGGGRLDISDNHLIDHNTGVGTATAGVYNGLSGLIQSGRNGGNWSGSGIVTSQTDATTSNFTSIGVAGAQDVKGLATATDTAVWAGQTVTGSDSLVMYTYGGDATLDGKINVDDYGKIDFNVTLPGVAGWINGDFNYDGKINVDDYGIIDFNVGIQGAPFFTAGSAGGAGSALTAVPEPAALALSGVGALGWISRRRRVRR